MAYDEALTGRVRHALASRTDVTEKRMFGGLTFMVAGNMCCGVNRDDLIIRLNANTTLQDLGSPHVRRWDFIRRPMRGIFAVGPTGWADQRACNRWVRLALRYTVSLAPK